MRYYKIEAAKFKWDWKPRLNIVVREYDWWLAEITMFYDPQLSAQVLNKYLPRGVVKTMFNLLREKSEVEVAFKAKNLPNWPWKPDAKSVKEAYFFPGKNEAPNDELCFYEDGFKMKIKVGAYDTAQREDIVKHFPPELASEGERLFEEILSNPGFTCGVRIQK